jgi:hypothetical protein
MKRTYYLKATKEPIEIISRSQFGFFFALSIHNKKIHFPHPWEITPPLIEEPDPGELIDRLKDPNYLIYIRNLFINALMCNSKLTETHKRLIKMYSRKS